MIKKYINGMYPSWFYLTVFIGSLLLEVGFLILITVFGVKLAWIGFICFHFLFTISLPSHWKEIKPLKQNNSHKRISLDRVLGESEMRLASAYYAKGRTDEVIRIDEVIRTSPGNITLNTGRVDLEKHDQQKQEIGSPEIDIKTFDHMLIDENILRPKDAVVFLFNNSRVELKHPDQIFYSSRDNTYQRNWRQSLGNEKPLILEAASMRVRLRARTKLLGLIIEDFGINQQWIDRNKPELDKIRAEINKPWIPSILYTKEKGKRRNGKYQ